MLCDHWSICRDHSRTSTHIAVRRWLGKREELSEHLRLKSGKSYDVPERLFFDQREARQYAVSRTEQFAGDLDFEGFAKPLEGLLALPIKKPMDAAEMRRFRRTWGPKQSDQTTEEFGPARAVLGAYVAAASPSEIKDAFDIPGKNIKDLICYCRDLEFVHKSAVELGL